MPGYAEPIRPGPILPGLVHDRLAHIEEHRRDHELIVPRAAGDVTAAGQYASEPIATKWGRRG